MTNVEFKVEGMHCPSCKMMIEDVLGDADGINKVAVALEQGLVGADYDEEKITEDEIKRLIEEEAGYKVKG